MDHSGDRVLEGPALQVGLVLSPGALDYPVDGLAFLGVAGGHFLGLQPHHADELEDAVELMDHLDEQDVLADPQQVVAGPAVPEYAEGHLRCDLLVKVVLGRAPALSKQPDAALLLVLCVVYLAITGRSRLVVCLPGGLAVDAGDDHPVGRQPEHHGQLHRTQSGHIHEQSQGVHR